MISIYASKRELIEALNELPPEVQAPIKLQVKETLTRLLRQTKDGLVTRFDLLQIIAANDRSFHAAEEMGSHSTMIENALIRNGAEELLQLARAYNEVTDRASNVQRIIRQM